MLLSGSLNLTSVVSKPQTRVSVRLNTLYVRTGTGVLIHSAVSVEAVL